MIVPTRATGFLCRYMIASLLNRGDQTIALKHSCSNSRRIDSRPPNIPNPYLDKHVETCSFIAPRIAVSAINFSADANCLAAAVPTKADYCLTLGSDNAIRSLPF